MSRPVRLLLLLLSLALMCGAALAVAYVLIPVERLREQNRPAPTLFVPPP